MLFISFITLYSLFTIAKLDVTLELKIKDRVYLKKN
jgi:hypothetical protein